MSHPLLTLEIRVRYRERFRLIVGGLLFGAVAFSGYGLFLLHGPGQRPLVSPGKLHAMTLVELVVVLTLPALLAIVALGRERQDGTLVPLLLGPWKPYAVVLSKLAVPGALALALIAECSLVLVVLRGFHSGVPLSRIFWGQCLLFVCAMALLTLGAFYATLLPDALSAVAVFSVTALLITCAPLVAGPLIARISNATALIQSTLLVSPVVGTGTAAGFDWMRSELVYGICSIGRRRFTYPAPWTASLFYVSSSAVFFAASVWFISRRKWV